MLTPEGLTPQHADIIRHSLGMDQYGQRSHGVERNYFVTDIGFPDGDRCQELVAAGFMSCTPNTISWIGGSTLFRVTQAGENWFLSQCPPKPKPTRSQERYQRYLDMDCSLSFREFLGINNKRKV